MPQGTARLTEIWVENDQVAGELACPAELIPAPGQYLLAQGRDDLLAPLPTVLFASGYTPHGFRLAPPLPAGWLPGTELLLRGPLGRGFTLTPPPRRLALAGLCAPPARLMPLLQAALEAGGSVVLYGQPGLSLPPAVEVLPLENLSEAPAWADFLALEAPLTALAELGRRLGAAPGERLPCAAQVLLRTPLPCAGLADCGACAVHTRAGWKLACKDGPVFDWTALIER